MNVIQIGCNNCQDDVLKFVSEKRDFITKFVVIDALPKCIDAAKESYSFLGDRLIPLCCAIGTYSGIVQFHIPLLEQNSVFASMSAQHLKHHGQTKFLTVSCPCLDINHLLSSLNFNKIDFLFIDIEGFDADVLLHLDTALFQPTVVEYESMHTDGPFLCGEKNQKVTKKFTQIGYKKSDAIGNYNTRFVKE